MVKRAWSRWRTREGENTRWVEARIATLGVIGALSLLTGCEVDSWFDPSRTGGFNPTATSMPILTRIDVIESERSTWRNAGPPQPEDLIPSELVYRLAPGDVLRIEVYELLRPGQMEVIISSVDQGGRIRLPRLGDVPAAGGTPQEVQEEIVDQLKKKTDILRDPIVNVTLESERSLQFSVLGQAPGNSSYRLIRPDVRLLEALASAGGVPATTDKIYIVRRVAIDESVTTPWEIRTPGADAAARPGAPAQPVDIETLIRDLKSREDKEANKPQGPSPAVPPGGANPGMLRQDVPPAVDVDELVPVRVADRPSAPPVKRAVPGPVGPAATFAFDAATNSWVRVDSRTAASAAPAAPANGFAPSTLGNGAIPPSAGGPIGSDILDLAGAGTTRAAAGSPLFAERVIVIEYEELISGDSTQNVVIRPNDLIYVQPQEFGYVYIDGEVSRPGVYELPPTGGLTLSRLIAAAGGLNAVAIPERVELVRVVGPNREAAIRQNLAAMRRRTEPDIYLRPDDHIIVGTNFLATPLAVIRNGFRMTYGFGFLLDRNFGNDVFGAPPTNIGSSGN